MVSDKPRIFQLRQELAILKQDQSTVDAYYTKLKAIWDELSNYRPKCTCGNCTCGTPSMLGEFNNEEHVMSFLMGLSESLSHIRAQILLMDPLPSMSKVFSLVLQEEKQKSITGLSGDSDSSARDELKKGDSEIHVPKKRVKVINVGSHPYHLRSCKRLNLLKSDINSLPDEILFDILVRIPAQDIYGAVKPVCLKWNQMISTHKFVNTHLHHSTNGLLLQDCLTKQLTFMSLSRQGQIEFNRLSYVPECHIWCSSCNGLILECERENIFTLFITNPVTMQSFCLPPNGNPLYCLGSYYSAVAYAFLSMEYKVVRVHSDSPWGCAILTVGVDRSWRRVCTQHISLEARKNFCFLPLTTDGFVHWTNNRNCVLTLNVETEIITEYLVPSSGDCFYYLSTVKYLSVLIGCGKWSWEVWEMKPETGEWTQLPGIDMKDRMWEVFDRLSERDIIHKSAAYINSWLMPVGWLEYKEVLLYCVRWPHPGRKLSICIAWNILLQEFEFIDLDYKLDGFFVHRNSLLKLDGC